MAGSDCLWRSPLAGVDPAVKSEKYWRRFVDLARDGERVEGDFARASPARLSSARRLLKLSLAEFLRGWFGCAVDVHVLSPGCRFFDLVPHWQRPPTMPFEPSTFRNPGHVAQLAHNALLSGPDRYGFVFNQVEWDPDCPTAMPSQG